MNKLSKKKLSSTFEYLGEGAARMVFALNNELVIKVPKNEFGVIQNDMENYIYNHVEERFRQYLCPVVKYHPDLMISARAIPIDSNREYFSNLRIFCGSTSFYQDILALSKEFYLSKKDIKATSSWGILNERKVIIDYGMVMIY